MVVMKISVDYRCSIVIKSVVIMKFVIMTESVLEVL